MIDTLKVTCAGMGTCWMSWMDLVPEIISMAVGCATLVYLVIKIVKEVKSK